jgi:FdhD protein
MEKYTITKIRGNSSKTVEDFLVEEVPLTITTGKKEIATFLCTPRDLEDLIRGFLFTSGLIAKPADIKKISVDRKRWTAYIQMVEDEIMNDMVFKRVYTSGCGRGILFYNAFDILKKAKVTSTLLVKHTSLAKLMEDFQKRSHLYSQTGGAHSAAIADEKKILVFREDIGRHNAIDKIIGRSLEEDIFLEDKILLTSGRISSEVLLKVQKCQIPIVISRGAPTNQAVKLAQEMGITISGFVRGKSMNIYTKPERIEI